jgi:hypothetical protein
MRIVRSVRAELPRVSVFRYLCDFTTTTDWDPATVVTELVVGDGGVGSRYRNVSRFLGRESVLDYEVTDLVPHRRLALRGENSTVVAHDVMTFTGDDRFCEVTYEATFDLRGPARLAGPVLRPAFHRLGDRAADGLRRALAQLDPHDWT